MSSNHLLLVIAFAASAPTNRTLPEQITKLHDDGFVTGKLPASEQPTLPVSYTNRRESETGVELSAHDCVKAAHPQWTHAPSPSMDIKSPNMTLVLSLAYPLRRPNHILSTYDV